ncbi:GNAT family N-acetyltransferase [Aquamicrobium zhengzhouense]|uniref:GNAT family N-acetyltransferase n=1 Tax=Aquamicrobium zhengzhouense TaxID=2781738 RepID=A0ABS0SA40_9HYPH|nr:GNAT family protein [Aquamicrobium zhengzhouense]MBI1619689.1 GNAT family N-acetyltransferase [Aquamicrobium zhengzhouense]
MYTDLTDWTPRQRPAVSTLEGRYVRLERLVPASHGDPLYAASNTIDAEDRFRWLGEYPPDSREEFQGWLENASISDDPMFYAVIDKASGSVSGRQSFMRIDPAHGVIEIGAILWNPPVARAPAATEALYLFARHVFDDLGYRRFEWKCNAENEPSKRAALRFGFIYEGTFRNHMVVKGKSRDTAWFSMIDTEWPSLRNALEVWLEPENFDSEGRQRKRLEEIRAAGS